MNPPPPHLPPQLKVMHMRIDGSTPAHERDKAVAAFQRLGPRTPRVALLSLHAAGTGLTLTAATVGLGGCVHVTLWLCGCVKEHEEEQSAKAV